jgi:hypothetical protein
MASTPRAPEAEPTRRFVPLGMLGGLLPQLLAIVPFVLGRWGVGVVVSMGGNAFVLTRSLRKGQKVGALEASSTVFSVLLAVGYFGFGNVFFLRHFGVVINALLLVQVVWGEFRGTPWTMQFSKRMYPAERWGTRAFFEGNRLLSRIWGAVFVLDILMSALGTTPLVLFVLPNALPLVALVMGPRLGHWYGARFSAAGTVRP